MRFFSSFWRARQSGDNGHNLMKSNQAKRISKIFTSISEIWRLFDLLMSYFYMLSVHHPLFLQSLMASHTSTMVRGTFAWNPRDFWLLCSIHRRLQGTVRVMEVLHFGATSVLLRLRWLGGVCSMQKDTHLFICSWALAALNVRPISPVPPGWQQCTLLQWDY